MHSNIIRLLALLHFRHQLSPTTSPLSTTRRVGTIKLKDSPRKLSESQQRPRQKNLQLIISTWAPLCCTKVCFYLRIYRHRSVLHNSFSQWAICGSTHELDKTLLPYKFMKKYWKLFEICSKNLENRKFWFTPVEKRSRESSLEQPEPWKVFLKSYSIEF